MSSTQTYEERIAAAAFTLATVIMEGTAAAFKKAGDVGVAGALVGVANSIDGNRDNLAKRAVELAHNTMREEQKGGR